MSRNLVKKIQNFSFQEGLWRKGSRIIIGVSGGPDSACLLDFFAKIQVKYDLKLLIAHVNYGLRGKDSDKDEKFVVELGKKYGIETILLKPTIRGVTSESSLRDIRYAFFEKLRQDNAFDLIAIAHSQDDQAETLLMRLIRGSGTRGLAAMRSKNNFIIRPLLKTSRQEIMRYLQQHRLKYRIDKTNRQTDFLRNKIRHQLLPVLEKKFNPRIKETLSKTAESLAEDDLFLDSSAARWIKRNPTMSISKLKQIQPAILKRIILLKIKQLVGNHSDVYASNLEEVLKILSSSKNKHQEISFRGLKFTRRGDRITLLSN